LTDLERRVVVAGKSEVPGLEVKLHVTDEPEKVRAFAIPGSRLYISSGLVLAARSEAELTGVLAHETGHVIARHPARHMVNKLGIHAVTALALGQDPGLMAKLATSAVSRGYMFANTLGDETEADEYGARLASRAGFDPNGIGQFWQHITASVEKKPSLLPFLNSHPSTPQRISHLDAYIASQRLGGGRKRTVGAAGGHPAILEPSSRRWPAQRPIAPWATTASTLVSSRSGSWLSSASLSSRSCDLSPRPSPGRCCWPSSFSP
jgi:predicted Zn-dependent protease